MWQQRVRRGSAVSVAQPARAQLLAELTCDKSGLLIVESMYSELVELQTRRCRTWSLVTIGVMPAAAGSSIIATSSDPAPR